MQDQPTMSKVPQWFRDVTRKDQARDSDEVQRERRRRQELVRRRMREPTGVQLDLCDLADERRIS